MRDDYFRVALTFRKYWLWVRSLEQRLAKIEKALNLSISNGERVETNWSLVAMEEELADAESKEKGEEGSPKGARGAPDGKGKASSPRKNGRAKPTRGKSPSDRKGTLRKIGRALRKDR